MGVRFDLENMNRKRVYSVQQIQNSFIALLKEKPCRQITVTDICKNANINRSTFYSNFIDIYDLVDYMLKAPLEQFRSNLDAYDSLGKKGYYKRIIEIYTEFDFFEIADLIEPIVSEEIARMTLDLWKKHNMVTVIDEDLVKFIYSFIAGGVLRALKDWYYSDYKISVDKMAEYLALLDTTCSKIATSSFCRMDGENDPRNLDKT